MAGITIPDKSTGDTLTAAEFNQLLESLKDGSRDVNLSADTVTEVNLTISNTATDGQVLSYKDSTDKLTWITSSGSGDMTKAVYDTNDDGTVDAADTSAALTGTQATAITTSTSHITSSGTSHAYIDQDVTSGATPTFTNTNFTEATNKNYVTDAEAIVIGNTSGTNTGDETTNNLTETTSNVLTITGGTNAIIGAGVTIEVDQADTSNDGYLSSTDWNTFNNKVTNATHSGDATGATALTLATVNTDVGSYTNSGITVNAKGLVTAASSGAASYTDLVEFVDQTAWRVFYSDTAGDVTELALGADGTFLKSNGAAAAPTFAVPAGSGDVTKVGTPVNDQVGIWTGDGTIEGSANLTFDGNNLTIGTNLVVGGTVDGIDVATDVAANTTHRGLSNNPHLVDSDDVSLGTTDDVGFNSIYVTSGQRIVLDGSGGDSYFIYNAGTSKVELFVDNTKKAEWG